MLDVAPGHPRYGVLVAKHHLRHLGAGATTAQKRQLARLAVKLARAADPGGWETRRDVAVLRRWLDALNAADRRRVGTRQPIGVSPAAAVAVAVDTDEFAARSLALALRVASDESVLYHKLVAAGEVGTRGVLHRAAVAVECAARPWLNEEGQA